MDIAAGLIDAGEATGPTVVVADHQTAGRGRADRPWQSTPGTAVQLTAILSLPVLAGELGPVPLIVGDMVAESLEATASGLDVSLKWPNDVLIDGRKVAGILIVSRSVRGSSWLQIGIGVNILSPAAETGSTTGLADAIGSEGGREAVASLRDRLLDEVLVRLIRLPEELAHDGGASGLARWARRAVLLGQPVVVRDGDRTVEGTLLGIDRTGALRVRTGPGQISTVVAGDLTRGPRLLKEHEQEDGR